MKETHKYFQDALSDFTYDAASGRAVRHLVDDGFTTSQIVQHLNYPTPFAKVRHTATRHLMETGILLDELPVSPASLHPVFFDHICENQLFAMLSQHIQKNKEEHSFISCPFGIMPGSRNGRLADMLSSLTAREREYIDGIEWMPKIMYHRLNRRMLEIGVQIAMHSDMIRFYFINTCEVIQVKQP